MIIIIMIMIIAVGRDHREDAGLIHNALTMLLPVEMMKSQQLLLLQESCRDHSMAGCISGRRSLLVTNDVL